MDRLFRLTILLLIVHTTLAIYVINATSAKRHENDNPAVWTEAEGIWGPALEEWAITNHREKRVMKLTSPSPEYNLSVERIDKPIEKIEDKESKISPGKIVNTGSSNVVNNNKRPPSRQITENELYLLGAIEKLVYRVDFMEKRLRKVEEMMYFVMAGNRIDKDPCPKNFTRAGHGCYLFSSDAGRELDWKVASNRCRKLGATLAEYETIEEYQDVANHIQGDAHLRGKDFWTGGLNPGLLWIWSNSARPVAIKTTDPNKRNPTLHISGDGRCLKLSFDPARNTYNYKGTDCSIRYSYICELPETTSSNEITRIGRERNIFDEL